MSEQDTNEDSSISEQPESDVIVLIKKMQQQISFLEKKIDILISQSQERYPREKQFSKPFRSFDRSSRPGNYHNNRDRSGDSRHSGRNFEKRHGDDNRRFSGPRKDYGDERENVPGEEGYFKKQFGDKKRGFDPRKKPFFNKRRER